MTDTMTCWHCGKSLQGLILPLSRREECSHCGVDLHVCKMCEHFNPEGRGDCTEERAEWQADRERANFCDYFTPNPRAYQPAQSAQREQAKAQFAALFGDEPETDEPQSDKAAGSQLTPAQIAEQKLRELLGG